MKKHSRRFQHMLTLLFLVSLTGIGFLSCRLSVEDRPTGYALIYGITEYDLIQDLVLTRDDAESMAELFHNQGYEVLLRIDNDNGIPASLDQLKRDIAYVQQVIKEDENFVFYFSGHGGRHVDLYLSYSNPPGNEGAESDSDDEWLFLYGSLLSTQYADWSKTALSDETLNTLIRDIPTPRKLIIIDACNSGGFAGTSPDIDQIPSNYEYPDSTVKEGIFSKTFSLYFSYPDVANADVPYTNAHVLSAAGEREFSWENSTIKHGIFTYYFLQSPTYGDRNRDGAVTIDEIYTYTSKRIINDWNSQLTNVTYHYHPHITGGPVMFALFTAQ